MSDTAEYWWDVKSKGFGYSGKNFRHNPNHKCSHYNPSSGNTETTIYLNDINCYECLKNIKNGIASTEGLKEGDSPEDFYMSKRQKKAYNKQKAFNETYGLCKCGSSMQIRTNKSNNQSFLGCIQYPKCKYTKSL